MIRKVRRGTFLAVFAMLPCCFCAATESSRTLPARARLASWLIVFDFLWSSLWGHHFDHAEPKVMEQKIDLIIPCTAPVESTAYAHLKVPEMA